MAVLGKYTLVKIGGVVIPAQMEGSLNFDVGLLETTEISGSYRYKTFDYDEKTVSGSLSLQYSDDIDSILFGIYHNAQVIEIAYGGVNIGEKYYLFNALINSIQRSDPSNGISMFSISFTVDGLIQRKTVVDPELPGQTWILTQVSTGGGTQLTVPSKANYDDGETVVLTPQPQMSWAFWKHRIGSALSNTFPLSLVMDSDKTVEFIYGYSAYDYYFDRDAVNFWASPVGTPFIIDYLYDAVMIEGSSVASTYFYSPLIFNILTDGGQSPIAFNVMRIYYDATDFNFTVNAMNSEDGSVASSGEITASSEPVFIKTFTEIKYTDRININATIFNTTSCTLRISRIVLDIV